MRHEISSTERHSDKRFFALNRACLRGVQAPIFGVFARCIRPLAYQNILKKQQKIDFLHLKYSNNNKTQNLCMYVSFASLNRTSQRQTVFCIEQSMSQRGAGAYSRSFRTVHSSSGHIRTFRKNNKKSTFFYT